jgi:hypothetical protein
MALHPKMSTPARSLKLSGNVGLLTAKADNPFSGNIT